MSLLEDFVSGDTSRVLHATWEVIGSRDRKLLDPLLPHLRQIHRATENLSLGGMLRSNSANLDHALEKLENLQRGTCWCENYAGFDRYEPDRERAAGYIQILSTSEPGWSMTYACECTNCGRKFDVEQGDYHVMWWKWVPRSEKRKGTRHD